MLAAHGDEHTVAVHIRSRAGARSAFRRINDVFPAQLSRLGIQTESVIVAIDEIRRILVGIADALNRYRRAKSPRRANVEGPTNAALLEIQRVHAPGTAA